MRAGHAPSPLDRHIDLFTLIVHIDGDALHQHTHDLLAVLRGRCRGVPQCWDIVSQAQDGLPLTGTSTPGTLASEPCAYLLQVLLVTERLFPAPLQLTGDEAVFGLDGFVLTSRPLGIGRARSSRWCQWASKRSRSARSACSAATLNSSDAGWSLGCVATKRSRNAPARLRHPGAP